MIAAFEKAVAQLGDPALRRVLWRTLAIALVAYLLIWGVAWWSIQSFNRFDIGWVNTAIQWLGGGAVVVASLLLFPASFGIILSLFLDEIADAVDAKHYPALGKAPGTPFATGLWSGVKFLVVLIVLNLAMLPVYLAMMLAFGSGAIAFYAVNGYLVGREYFEQVALRRLPTAEATALRKQSTGALWLVGVAIAIMGTVPFLNLLAPVLGTAMMVHTVNGLLAGRGAMVRRAAP